MAQAEKIVDRVYQVGGGGLSHPADCLVQVGPYSATAGNDTGVQVQ